MSPPAPATPDPHLADAIMRAEKSRAMLERLSEFGMELAETIAARAAAAPAEAEPRHDPGRAFAVVSRAVRLTLALALRIDDQVLAKRRGAYPVNETPRRAESKPMAPGSMSSESPGPRRHRIRDAVWSAINAEVEDITTAERALSELHECLIEGDDYDRFVFRPWRETVEAICADLGLSPDWSRWSDDTGFETDPDKPGVKWNMIWKYRPEQAEFRRRRRADIRSADVPSASTIPKAADGTSALRTTRRLE